MTFTIYIDAARGKYLAAHPKEAHGTPV